MEIWDAYNKDGSLAGVDIIRGTPVPEGLYYLVVEILVRHTDGDFLLMQRAWTKPSFGGMYEASAGGAAQKGESPIEAARRELREETGIVSDSLEEIEVMLFRNMIVHQYICITDCAKDAITLQEGETIGYKWISEKEFIDFVNSGEMIPTQKERMTDYFKKMGYLK